MVRHLARRGNLDGETSEEKTRVDMICEGINDFKSFTLRIPFEKAHGNHAGTLQDLKRGMAKYMPRFETMLAENGANGFMVGSKMTAADIMFGSVSPSGRLPITFPKSLDQLPPYEDYSMSGRTYRYMTEDPMYPFGFGLSYASFEYSGIQLSSPTVKKNESVRVSCTLTNSSETEADEIVQLYIRIENEKIKSKI